MPLAKASQILVEVIGLQTPRGRLFAFTLGSTIIYLLPYHVVGQFSLWQRLGWTSAPSIGLTRAYWLLMHGQADAAWNRNWLIYPIIFVVVIIVGRDMYKLFRSFGRSVQCEK